jgi:Short C-terminal domain
VRHPDAVQQEIYRQMEAHSRKRASWGRDDGAPLDTTPSTVAAGPSIPDQLRQLADLRDQGIISPAEFETKKAQLLERM